MRIALATCDGLPDWEVDDAALHEALRRRGVDFERPVWDDPDVNWSAYDGCLIRTTWDYMEKRDAYVAWSASVAALIPMFNDPEVVRWNTHKSYLRDLEARGAPVIPTIWCLRGERPDLRSALSARGWRRGFLKPAVGATARATMRFGDGFDGLDTAQAHLDRMLAAEDMLIQPYLARVETDGERSAIFIDGRITHTVRKVPVPGDYRVQDDFGAHDEPFDLSADDRALAERIVSMVEGDLLYARVDFLTDDEGATRITELELVEPSLFFRHGPHAADLLVDGLLRRIGA